MAIAGTRMPWIRFSVIPHPLELVRDEGPDDGRPMAEVVGAIPEIRHGLEQHRDPMPIHLPTTGVNEGAFRRI
jgi:hypothetical protein